MVESKRAPKETGARTWLQILNYQGMADLGRCLKSVRRQREPEGGVHLVVVDNASGDGSPALLEREYADFELIECPRNLGFAGGNNLGLRSALASGAEYAVLLNMDTKVDPGWLVELVAVADEVPEAALVGARLLSADGAMLEFDGRQFDRVSTSGGYADRPPEPEEERYHDAAYACGAAALLRLSALREVGFFDDSFFAYHEDVELSLRCWLHGHRVLNASEAVVYHRGGGAGAGNDFRDFMGSRNLVLTLLKLYDLPAWNRHGTALAARFLDHNSRHLLRSLLAASFEAPDALRQRRRLRRRAELTYSELLRQRRFPGPGNR